MMFMIGQCYVLAIACMHTNVDFHFTYMVAYVRVPVYCMQLS